MSAQDGRSGSTRRLIELCVGYFLSYVLTGIAVKWFTGGLREPGEAGMPDIAYLFNNTLGGNLLCLAAVFALGWVWLPSARRIRWLGLDVPAETVYIVPSGICTGVIIPTTTLMYTLPISVMVAMVIMRGSIIVISRLVDAVQIRQGILRRRVYPEEDWGVVFALLALGVHVLLGPLVLALEDRGLPAARTLGLSAAGLRGGFDFLHEPAAIVIMSLYIVAYAIRLYLMNYFKNTRGPGPQLDNRGFFAIEQIAATATIALAGAFFYLSVPWLGWSDHRLLELRAAVHAPDPWAILSGVPYGLVAFFSVFLFMFKGRTATFAGLVNRLTSLLAGTVATLILAWWFHLRPPSLTDWISFGFILVAVAFLARAERRRSAELAGAAS